MDREAFLARVAGAASTGVLPVPVPTDLPDPGAIDLSALFRERAQSVNAVVHAPVSRHGVPRVVVGIAAGHGASNFVAWDDLPAAGVASALVTAGLERFDHLVPDEGRREHLLSYRSLQVGVTGAEAGLAESGSVVLRHGVGRPRLASLIPEIHIVLLEMSTLSRTLARWARENPASARETTNLVIVTGPSRTGDIEQTLNLGVHGPRHVHIVMFR